MFRKLVFILAVVALLASAGTVPGVGHYRITLIEPANVGNTLLKAGDYRIDLAAAKLTFIPDEGKNKVEVAVKVETENAKFHDTVVQVDKSTGKAVISEIRIGGTKTKLILE